MDCNWIMTIFSGVLRQKSSQHQRCVPRGERLGTVYRDETLRMPPTSTMRYFHDLVDYRRDIGDCFTMQFFEYLLFW